MSRKDKNVIANRPNHAATLQRTSVHFSGPLPTPEILRRYNEFVPGSTERIIRMAELQAEHRRGLEKDVVAEDIGAARRGSVFAFILALVVVIGGFALIAVGKNSFGIAAIITALTSLAGVFVYGRRRKSKDLEANRKAIEALESRSVDQGTAE